MDSKLIVPIFLVMLISFGSVYAIEGNNWVTDAEVTISEGGEFSLWFYTSKSIRGSKS
jgi:hypothetical protein